MRDGHVLGPKEAAEWAAADMYPAQETLDPDVPHREFNALQAERYATAVEFGQRAIVGAEVFVHMYSQNRLPPEDRQLLRNIQERDNK